MMTTSDVIVVGAGVIGSAIAYNVARSGARVTLIDRANPPAGATASSGSAGGVRQQGRVAPEIPLSVHAIAMWPGLAEELGMEIGYRQHGMTICIDREEDRVGLADRIAREQALGLKDIRMIEEDELRRMEPGITPRIIAGSLCPSDGHADPMLTTKAFLEAARRHGARIETNCPVTGLVREGERYTGVETPRGTFCADRVILASGSWTPTIAQMAGVELPIRMGGLQMMVTQKLPPMLKQVLGWIGHGISLKQAPAGGFVIGGAWPGVGDLNQARSQLMPGSIAKSAMTCAELFPSLASVTVVRAWVGMESFCPDDMPIIGPLPGVEGWWVAAGFSGHGFALSPAVGQLLSEAVLTGRIPALLEPFTATRFADGEGAK